jgi:hypothetical protein
MGGALQELGFPDVFGKDPTKWGIWKMGMALANYGMGVGKYLTQPGSKFALGPGSPAGLAAALSGKPGTDALGAGLGGGPGGTNINNFDLSNSVGRVESGAMASIAAATNPAGGASSATATVGGAQGAPG